MLDLDAKVYASNNQPQQSGAVYVLEQHLKLIRWHKRPTIMDVGTGDGTVLLDVLVPRLPQDFQKVVAIDINQEMLDIANNKSKRNSNIDFFRMDIATPSLPLFFLGNFDHIFSFFCLHWIIDQRRAFTNLFAMLKPGGDMLLTLIAKDVASRVYEKMIKINTWAPFMTDIEKYTYPYHHSSNPAVEVEEHLKTAGFIDYVVTLEDKVHLFKNLAAFWEFSCGINPFIKRISPEYLDMYRRDYLNEIRQDETMLFEEGGEIRMPSKMLIVYAAKPENIPKSSPVQK